MTFESTQRPVERVNYATGMMLAADDFRAEQQYHRGRLAQFLRFAIGKGTLAGLAVEGTAGRSNPVTDPDYTIFVRPGLAIDGLGGLIEVTRDYKISLRRWVEANAKAVSENNTGGNLIVDIVVSARDLGRAKTPSFADGPIDALDSVVPSRIEDGFLLDIVLHKIEPPLPTISAAAAKAPDNILDGWTFVMADGGAAAQGLLLARIRNCGVSNQSGKYTIAPGQSLSIDNKIRPFVWIAGQSLAQTPR